MGGAAAAWVGPAAGAGDACHHLGMKALAWPLRQHTTTTAASANPAPLLHLFPFLVMISLSLSLSLSRSPPLATVCDLAEGAGCLGRYACGPRFERWFRGNALASRFRIVWFGPNLGGEISTEISLKSRPTLAASKRVFFFCGSRSHARSARSAPTSISPPLPPPPPPSERGCPRREEPPAGAGSRRPNSVTVASTDGVLLLLESLPGSVLKACVVSWNSWLELCELVVVVE